MTSKVLELVEYQPLGVDAGRISETAGKYLYDNYRSQVSIDTPSFKTDGRWQLTSNGWVGFIPIEEGLGLSLLPKVPIANLFRMLEYAYDIEIEILDGSTTVTSIEEYYERLANVLALRVLDRSRAGLYRSYVPEEDRLPYVRGSLQVDRVLRRPWDVTLDCAYQEHTSDLEENQILAWTLFLICRSGICSPRIAPTVRRAFRCVQGAARLVPYTGPNCGGRTYNRLNQDYEPMHALCRFFLDHTGPTHDFGDRRMLPFLVDMAKLFEKFVAVWLRQNLPSRYELREQQAVGLDREGVLRFLVDLVIHDRELGAPVLVLDTKYKKPGAPASEDVQQVIAYAESLGCKQSGLIYPRPLEHPVETTVGSIEFRTLTFDLSGDLEKAGREMLRALPLEGVGDEGGRVGRLG